MRYGVAASTRPDSVWGSTRRWCQGKDGQPLAFETEEQAKEAALAFAEQNGRLNCWTDYTALPLEGPPWEMR